MTQISYPGLPCLRVMHDMIPLDTDTNYLIEFIPPEIRPHLVIGLTKCLHDRLKLHKHLFKSPKQIEWALEILGYSFVPPQFPFFRDDKNYLESVLGVYEYILCGQVNLELEGKNVEFQNMEGTLNFKDPHHQSIMMQMLCHMTLLFDEKNFEKRYIITSGDNRAIEDDLKIPAKLSGIALKIYNKFIFRAYPFLAAKHWVTLIKMLIGLSRYLLEPSSKVKLPEKVTIAAVELLYNTWILSGLQDETLWEEFKYNIHALLHKSMDKEIDVIVVSYWSEVCVELTTKLLTDKKCFPPPKLVVINDKKQLEYQKNLLIIHHLQQSSIGDIEFSQKSKSLLPQPFLFRISSKQTVYLWTKMVSLMGDANFKNDPKIHSLILKGISQVISLILKVGIPYKVNTSSDGLLDQTDLKVSRKIVIKQEFDYFKQKLKFLLLNKVQPNCVESPDTSPQVHDQPKIQGLTPIDADSGHNAFSAPTLKRMKSLKEKAKVFDFSQEIGWHVKDHKVPAGDLLLKIFGRILFESLEPITFTSSEEVRLTSITTLCQIFTKARGPFAEPYLKKFYRTYLQYLKEENFSNTLQTLLKHSCGLFTSITAPTSIMIQIPLLKKLLNYYHIAAKSENSSQDLGLRSPSNKLLSSILHPLLINGHLIDQAYSQERSITDVLQDLLNYAIKRDQEALLAVKSYQKILAKEIKNLARSSWNLMIYSFAKKKMSPLIANINDVYWLDKSLPALNKLTLDMFQALGELCLSSLKNIKTDDAINDAAFAGTMILDKINSFLHPRVTQLNENRKPSSLTALEKDESRNMISYAFVVAYTWVLILLYFNTRLNINNKRQFLLQFTTTFNILRSFASQEPYDHHIKNILEVISSNFGGLNCTKNLPFTGSVMVNSDPDKPLSEATKELEKNSLIHIAVGEETVLSFYGLEAGYADETVIVVVRNSVGKAIWSGSLFYKLPNPVSDEPEKIVPKSQESNVHNEKKENDQKALLEEKFFGTPESLRRASLMLERREELFKSEPETLMKKGRETRSVSVSKLGDADALKNALNAQFEAEQLYEEHYNHSKGKDSSSSEDNIETSENSSLMAEYKKKAKRMNSVKMLLASSGLLQMENIEKNFVYIPLNDDVISWFNQIDKIPMRAQILADIVYTADAACQNIERFKAIDLLFEQFIESVGVVVNEQLLETGTFETIRDYVKQHKKVVFASNVLYEFVFPILNLEAPETIDKAEKPEKEVIGTSPIVIIWNARLNDPHDKTFPLIMNKLKIDHHKSAVIITPLDNGHFRIDVFRHKTTFCLFSQVKGFVCAYDLLPAIVLQIIASLNREYQVHSEQLSYLDASLGNLAMRQKNISTLVRHYKPSSDDAGDFLKALLGCSVRFG